MKTSLAAQLQKLTVPQTSLLDRDKKKPSLLFDPKEAATIDRDTFYDIGLSGLRDLKALDEDFGYFENNLFSSTSRNIERAVLDEDTNYNLNNTLKKFFTLLSPYFLLKPAHKALEWLIQRFSIHEFNINEFLKLILPYHETNVFVRCLRLLTFTNKNDDWSWLQPLQKSGVSLSKTALYNCCANDAGLFKYINKMVFDTMKEKFSKPKSQTILFNFYCTTVTGTMENIRNITEPQLTAILPSLLKGLLSDIPDYIASTYIITAHLIKKTKLSVKLLNTLVLRISSNTQCDLYMEATLLLLLVYQSQHDNFTTISDKALENLAINDWFIDNLEKLAASGSHVLPLLSPVLRITLNKIQTDKCRRMAERIFSSVRLENNTLDYLIRIVIESCPSSQEDNTSVLEWYATFLKQIETQYPNVFDKIMRNIFAGKTSVSQKQAQALKHIMKFSISGGDEKSNYTIFEKLYHPNINFRHSAIEFLLKNHKKISSKDKEMLQGALNEFMIDKDKRIVKTLLKLQHNDLVDIVGENNFINIVLKVLTKCIQDKNYYKLMSDLIRHICYGSISKNSILLLPLFPFLFPINDSELEISKTIIFSDFSRNYEFLNNLKNDIKKIENSKIFCDIIYSNLLQNGHTLLNYVNTAKSCKDMICIHKYLNCLLIASSLSEKSSAELGMKALSRISSYLGQTKISEQSNNFNLMKCILHTRNDILPLEGILECIKIVINRTERVKMKNAWLSSFSSSTDNSINFVINMLSLLVKGCHSNNKYAVQCYSICLKMFMNKFFSCYKEKIEFLANFLVYDNNICKIIDSKTQFRILKILTSLLLRSNNSILWTVEFNSNILIPAILMGLIHSHQDIRMVTFEIVDILVNVKCKNVGSTYILFLNELLKHKPEILLDCEQLPLILYTLVENSQYKKSFNTMYNMVNAVNVPMHVNAKLLKILTFINSNEILENASQIAVQILKSVNNANHILDICKSFIVYHVFLRFNENTASGIELSSCSWELISFALKQDVVRLEYQQNKYSCSSLLVLDQINKEVFNNLNSEIQSSLFNILIDTATESENPDVVSAIYKLFKKLDLDAKLIIDTLITMKNIKSSKNNLSQRKFRRASEIPTTDILDMIEWKRGLTVLEIIQDKKKLRNANILLPELFGLLKKCLDFDEQGSVEYPKQIILSAILHICNKLQSEGPSLPTTVFNMELVVQCIRASPNPQTHHHALLLLAYAAVLVPDQVLHNIMAIFTFMGSSVLRHDDAYSFQIISKIIDTVIPILVHGNNEQTEANVASVLRVFVDVILDIPEHRRTPLLRKLLVTLGVEDYMWLFLVLIFEAHVVHGPDSKPKEIKRKIVSEYIPKRLEIATNISLEFSPTVIISTTIKVMEYLKSLPNNIDENVMDIDNSSTFNIRHRTPKQFRHYKYTLVTFLSGLLSSKKLVNMIAVLSNDDLLKLEPSFKNMVINILTHIQSVSKIVDRMSSTPQGQYWKVLLHHCFDIMDSINALLTTEMFLLVIRGLIVHNIPTVRRKAIEILNNKLQHQPSFFYSSANDSEIKDPEGLFALIPSLINIIKSVEDKDIEPEEELIQQTTLLSLKLLTKLLAANNPDKFIPILIYMTDLIKSNKLSGNILASVVLCLAELCSKLRAHAIPELTRYMPALIKVLKTQKHQEVPGLLLMCIITAIQKIVESLPLFLSPYLEKLLCEITKLSVKWCNNEDNNKLTHFVKKLDTIRNNIGSVIPSRILIPIIIQTYNTLLKETDYLAVGPLMSVLSENLSHLQSKELNIYLPELTTFFVTGLQFRTDLSDIENKEIVTIVEDNVMKCVITCVLKLSETSFRPFYYRLYDWAFRNDVKSERVITFYRLSFRFAENLKSLFVLFAGHFVKNAASLLDFCNLTKSDHLYFTEENKNILLIESILSTLKLLFSYDSQNFVDKDRFETLMQPIVDQLENTIGGIGIFTIRADNVLIPCITQFAVAIADDTLWKQLNYQILLKTRHNIPEVRLIALNCLCEVARKLGEDFLPLLPETIPFLAELLEDEDERVEGSCQRAVQDLEKTLGEPLQKYF